MADELQQVAIRMVEQPPLYSNEPMNNPDAAVRVMNDFLAQMDRELFCIVNLQADLTPINMNVVSVGALNEAMVHPREIFKSAILSNAHSMMLVHNYPSGNLTPSEEDIVTTARMQQLGEMMGIHLVDHIITGRDRNYYSFRDKGVFPDERVRYSIRLEDIDLTTGMVAENNQTYSDTNRQNNKQGNTQDIQPVQTTTVPLPVQGKDMDSIMKSLETGVENLFTSEKYADYLKTMAKFHRYSFNNTLLIAMQRPDATLVTGYNKWKSMGRQVKKGEKGITIIAPVPMKQKREREVLDKDQMPVMDSDGKPMVEEVEVTLPRFKATTVFDINQTYGDPIPTLNPEELTSNVENYEIFMEAIKRVSPVPIRFDEIEGGAKGYYHTVDKEVVIQKGMSESQTMKTALHEVAGHARMHDRDLMKANGIEKDQMTKEVEAESVAFACAAYYNLDTSDYSFPYIAGWSSGKDMKELKASMDEIRQAAGSFIDEMDEQIQILVAERDQKKLTGNLEDQLLNSGESRYGIYQIKDGSGGERYEFMGMDFVKEQNLQVVGAHYELVYSGVLTANDSLDSIYEKFNINHPEDFTGHSLSVSDIVVLAGADGVTAHYVDSFGFADVPQFVEQRRNMVAATQKDQEMTFDKQAEKLASDIDAYSFDFDQHGYQDAVENREAAVADLKKDILSGNTDGVTKWLQEIVDEADMNLPEDVSKAQELITRLEQAKQIREQDQTMVKDVAITFYVAECMEFPVMGEYHEGLTLPEALEAYEKIPSDRRNGIKGIGFNLQDGSDYEGNYELLTGTIVQREAIEMIDHYKGNPLVQKAMADVDKYLEDKAKSVEKTTTKKRATTKKKETKKEDQEKAQKSAKTQKRKKEEQSL